MVCTPAIAHAMTAPVITSIDMNQAYKIHQFDGSISTSKGTVFGKGDKSYVAWGNGNIVKIRCKNSANVDPSSVQYFLQRSTSKTSGYQNVVSVFCSITYKSARAEWSDTDYYGALTYGEYTEYSDYSAKRGKTYYYRVLAKSSYYDEQKQTTVSEEKISNIVSIRTSPKTFSATSFKVKTSKGWKKTATVKGDISKVKRSHRYKISWKKRNDVSGYYVYKLNVHAVALKNLKKWQYAETGYSEGLRLNGEKTPERDYITSVTAPRWCKKVATLKANATSYTFSLKANANRHPLIHTAYVIVPFVKQNGKVYMGDAKKVYYPFIRSNKKASSYKIYTKNIGYLTYIPFAL